MPKMTPFGRHKIELLVENLAYLIMVCSVAIKKMKETGQVEGKKKKW